MLKDKEKTKEQPINIYFFIRCDKREMVCKAREQVTCCVSVIIQLTVAASTHQASFRSLSRGVETQEHLKGEKGPRRVSDKY